MTSSESMDASFDSFVATPRAGLYSRVRTPFLRPLLAAKMGVRETSWHRKVQRFLTSLSEGLVRTGESGAEQMSMKAAMAFAERAWRSTSSSACEQEAKSEH